jgi:alginate O-acetyltransferase complex protein AlgI
MWLAIERALGLDTNPQRFNPVKWAFTFLLVVVGWVIFRAENLHVAARMYGAMFSFGEWQLSELNRANLTGLQVATLVVAYATLAFFGLRDFYRNAKPTPKATPVAVHADGTMSLDWTRVLSRTLVLALFAASILKLSAQSYSPFLYFQF